MKNIHDDILVASGCDLHMRVHPSYFLWKIWKNDDIIIKHGVLPQELETLFLVIYGPILFATIRVQDSLSEP